MEKSSNKERTNTLKIALSNNKVFVILIGLVVIMSFASPQFLTTTNMMNVLRQVAVTGIVAAGFTLIIGSGSMDLSIGSTMGFVGVVVATLIVKYGVNMWLAMLVGIVAGAICGIVNASIISALDLPPFIVTLAMQSVLRGLVYISTQMIPVVNLPENFVAIGQGYIGPIPTPVVIMFATYLIMLYVANKTSFGRYVIAMGGNKEAAYLCGINISHVRMGVYMTAGICAAVASIVLTGRTASAQIAAGTGMEFECITAAVIGGTVFGGGTVRIMGTLFGCLIVGIINNGLNLMGVDSNYQIIVKGLMILFALVIDRLSTSLMSNKKAQ